MLAHIAIQCADVTASAEFYDTVFAPLGVGRVMEYEENIGYGVGRPTFWIGPLTTGEPNREVHIAFTATDRAAVRAFFDAAIAGGADGAARAAGVARVPPDVLRRLRARPRRQQRRSRLPRPGVAP